MLYSDDIILMKLYRRSFILPLDLNNKLKGSCTMLLTPNYQSTVGVLKNKFIIPKYYKSYFIEKNIGGFIDNNNLVSETSIYEDEEIIQENYATGTILYSGNKYDINICKNYINFINIEKIAIRYRTKIKASDLNVIIYPIYDRFDIPKTTYQSINIQGFSECDDDILMYEKYCIATIVRFIILNINYDINPTLLDAFCYYESGVSLYTKKEKCKNIAKVLRLIENKYGINKLISIIKNNRYSSFEPYITDLGIDNVTKFFTEDAEPINDIKKIVRSIKYKSRRSIHNQNKISKIIDPLDDHKTDGISKDNKSTPGLDKNLLSVNNPASNKTKKEDDSIIKESVNSICNDDEIIIDEDYIKNDDYIMFFESAAEDSVIRRILWKERLKTNKDVFNIHTRLKEDVPYINYTYINYDRYNGKNLFIDLSYYNNAFFKNNMYKLDRGINLYLEFLNKLINDTRISNAGYNKKFVIIPIQDWNSNPNTKMWMYNENINPVSVIYRLIKKDINILKETFKNIDFLFLGEFGYFKLNFNTFENKDIGLFLKLINRSGINSSIDTTSTDDEVSIKDSHKAIAINLVDKIEKSKGLSLTNISSISKVKDTIDINKKEELKNIDNEELNNIDKKDELVKKIAKASDGTTDEEEALSEIDDDESLKRILMDLSSEEGNDINLNTARGSRIIKLRSDLLEKEIKGKKISEMLKETDENRPLEVISLDIDTPNEEFKNLSFMNLDKNYDINDDIISMLNFLSTRSIPIAIRDIDIADTSTSEDYIDTYTVGMEDINGKRFTLKFDIPKFKDNKYMILRGNKKNISNQFFLIPLSKTDNDTVQLVTNYKKIFFRRFGSTTGKSYCIADRLIKSLSKQKYENIEIITGDNSLICNKYELPIDYIDLSSVYNKIILNQLTCKETIYFNQDALRNDVEVNEELGLPIGIREYYNKKDIPNSFKTKDLKQCIYFKPNYEIKEDSQTVSEYIYKALSYISSDFDNIFNKCAESVRYTYSKASILSTEIPIIIICAYHEGLTKILKKAGIVYELSEKRPKYSNIKQDLIKFKDGYLLYDLNYESSLLMNGLKAVATTNYSIKDINNKTMYIEILDLFGGRIKTDGLDNFYDLMIEPISISVLKHYKLTTDYVGLLLHANGLLADNKYFRHTDARTRRIRKQELVAGYFYYCLSKAYGDYRTSIKHGRDNTMSMKQSAVIDAIMKDPTMGDLSILNPLLEIESYNSLSFKGLSGLNSDRSYSLDKRGYDESMNGIVGLSTGFAENVGITRQTTIDANVEGTRGYVKIDTNTDNMSITKTLAMTEALTPFGTTRDDPFRSAMNFVQRAKHGVRIVEGSPSLISNGADEALPYMISDTFAFKSKDSGEVIFKSDEYMLIKYNNGNTDYVDLSEVVEKNSSGGFFVTIKKNTKYEVGDKFKNNEILAYDKTAFSDTIGITNNIAYSIGAFTKIAIMNTDEGYEDSTIISNHLSSIMASEQVLKKDITLDKSTNILKLVKIGEQVEEGYPLAIIQTAYDEEDSNKLLKSLIDDEDEINNLGRMTIKAPITGVVQDIVIYRTVELNELSPSILKIVNAYEKPIREKRKILKNNNIEDNTLLRSDYKLQPVGKLKNVLDGIQIDIYVKYYDKMSIGDKLINSSALKGVVKDIFPIGLEPSSSARPDERINILLAVESILARMTCSIKITAAINKVLVELDRANKDTLGIKYDINL